MSETFDILKNYVDQSIIPGFTSSLINGDVVRRKYYGKKSNDEFISSEHVLYDIASLTKLFTTTRILQMVQEGVISLETTICTVLCDFKNKDITLRHLLLHNSGFAPSAKGRYSMNADELRVSILRCEDLVGQLGVDTVYSCINFVILGFIIESMDGDLQRSFKDNIFNKCGMTQTKFGPVFGDVAPSKIVDGIEIRGSVSDTTAKVMNGVCGNAGLFSNVIDLEKFVLGYINGTLLRKDMLSILKEININSRTLGWNLLFNKTGHLYHTGFTGPSIYLDLDRKLSLIIMTNRNILSNSEEYLDKRNELMSQFLIEHEK